MSLGKTVTSNSFVKSTACLVMGLALAACSRDTSLGPSDPVFQGLTQSVVQEVLASPSAKQRVEGDDPETAKARYQGMVRNFIACRAALSVYQGWVKQGTPPALPSQPKPTNPVSTAADMDGDIARFKESIASGDISLLREQLTNDSGCGAWIPAVPGRVSGPTIAQVVKAAA